MSPDEVSKIFQMHWKPGYGSILASELDFVQALIRERRPKSLIEIGMASGLSAALFAKMMEENGGERIVTIDHDNTFFGDPSKPNGFLIDEIYQDGSVEVQKLPFKTALDVPVMDETFDLAFIDANHQHPWPTIDTLCVAPFLNGDDPVVIHHDLALYRKQDVPFGIGPKYLYDQFPSDRRFCEGAEDPNIFALRLGSDRDWLEKQLIASFLIPWTPRTPIQPEFLAAIRSTIENHYSSALLDAFNTAERRYNKSFGEVEQPVEVPQNDSFLTVVKNRFFSNA